MPEQSTNPVIGNPPLRWTLVASGFAEDDAVLAKNEVFPDGGPVRVSFVLGDAVRAGDLVSTVRLDAGTSEATARDIAAKAAARLRQLCSRARRRGVWLLVRADEGSAVG